MNRFVQDIVYGAGTLSLSVSASVLVYFLNQLTHGTFAAVVALIVVYVYLVERRPGQRTD